MNIFFYGLFMDEDLLRNHGLHPSSPRRARLDGFRLHIGQRATLVREDGQAVYGMVMNLSDQEAEQLYAQPSVADYRPEDVSARLDDGSPVKAVCYNLPADAVTADSNQEYANKLHKLAATLGFPAPYLSDIARQGGNGS